jgi:tryptophan synthase alpha chain
MFFARLNLHTHYIYSPKSQFLLLILSKKSIITSKKKKKRLSFVKKLVAYITSSYPSSSFTIDLAHAFKEAGVDYLELGVPFSDPVADGPVIEKANLKSLQNGFKIDELFKITKEIAPIIDTLWMGYFNPFYHKGLELFIQEAKNSQLKGFIIPDLPHEEAQIYKPIIEQNGLSLIDFVAPTDSKTRVEKIVKDAKEFIYMVAYAGITGSSKSEDLKELIDSVKEFSNTPLFIGFGVNEKNAKEKAKDVDGVIVGSEFVKVLLEESLSSSQKIDKIASIAKNIKESINS